MTTTPIHDMSIVPCLPQETLEGIIDFLYNDRRSLFACSLASPKFVAVSRYHLFSEVTSVFTKFQRLLELLDAPWSSLANTISRLIITGDNWNQMSCQARSARRRALKLPVYVQTDYLPEQLSRIRERLQSVSFVRFSDLSPKDVPESFWNLLEAMKGVKAVEAHCIGFLCPLPFFDFISSLPSLERLSISRPTVTMSATQLAILRRRICEGVNILLPQRDTGAAFQMPLLDLRRTFQIPTQDQSLNITTVAGIAVLEWMLEQNPRPSVKTLRLNLDYEQNIVNLLSIYFQAAGSKIDNLCVVLPSSVTALHSTPLIDFSPLTRIRHLHVEGLFMSHDTSAHVLETFFRGLFAQLLSSSSLAMQNDTEVAPTPLISKVTITLTMDAQNEVSFFGMPDHAVLQTFTWFSLPAIMEEAFRPFPETLNQLDLHLRVRSTVISGKDAGFTEEIIREGAWKGFNERGRTLRVGFLPMLDRDGDNEDLS